MTMIECVAWPSGKTRVDVDAEGPRGRPTDVTYLLHAVPDA